MEIICFVLFSLLTGFAAFVIFLRQMKKGHFDDLEETKYQIFREEDDA
ncbi:MAG: hypothetical protein S4CHLAM81_02060 [Chlamydiales bacterium]|nr:hypothetical protein [Chlamydiales bacterium]MCH9635000.1 hypothetical protein [Chlamydiales bacterium]MCH9704160.1 cbb3-type cytochrome oxidase assembly protein CcoS [Chlamydiota bacterium]